MAHARVHTYEFPPRRTRCFATALAGPGVAVGHHLAAPDPSGATSGPWEAPNGVNLAPGRSHQTRRRRWPPRGGLAAPIAGTDRAACAPRTRPTLLAVAQPAPTACATYRRPLRPLRAAERTRRPAGSARCNGRAAALVPEPARQTAPSVVGDPGTRPRKYVSDRAFKSSQVKSS